MEVYLPQDAVIADEKLTQYLLVWQPRDDKSKFLAKAGYTIDNPQQLEQDLRLQVLSKPAEKLSSTRFGDKYEIRAHLQGPNGRRLKVVTVWMVTENLTKFITLVPDKGVKDDH